MGSENLLIDEQPLVLLPSLAEKVGINLAIVLQQIHYWLKLNEKDARHKKDTHFFDNRWWAYNTYADWQRQDFRFWSVRTIERIFAGGVGVGIILSRYHQENNKGQWWSIDYEKLRGYDKLADPGYDKLADPPRQVGGPLSTTETTDESKPETTEESGGYAGLKAILNTPPTPHEYEEESLPATPITLTYTPKTYAVPSDPIPNTPTTGYGVPKKTHPSAQAQRRQSGSKKIGSESRSETRETKLEPRRTTPLPAIRPSTPQTPGKSKIEAFLEGSDAFVDWWIGLTGRNEIQNGAWDAVNQYREAYKSDLWRQWAEEVIAESIEGSVAAHGKKTRDITLCERLNNDAAYDKWLSQNHSVDEESVVVIEEGETETIDEMRQRTLDIWRETDPEKYKMFSEIWGMQ